MKKIDEKIIRFIKENELINQGDKILVAFSGGPDSVFLLKFLIKYQRMYKIKIGAVHINHLIRGKEGDEDEKFCEKFCSNEKVVFYTAKRNVPQYAKKKKISLEEAAREVRYDELSKIRLKFGYDKIATAHNCSDNAETVFLNLIKGAGLKGLSGIPITRGKIIRPILPITKDEIIIYLEKQKVKYVIDKTNTSNEYERNLIRNELIPVVKKHLNPKIEQSVFKSSLVLKKQFEILGSLIKIISEIMTSKTKYGIELDIDKLSKFDNKIWTDVIKYSADRNLDVNLSFNDCNKLASLMTKKIGSKINILQGLSGLRERSKIIIRRLEKQNELSSLEIKVGESVQIGTKKISVDHSELSLNEYSKDKSVEFIDADQVSGNFIVRKWKNGDRFYPLGLKGSKKVSDFLNSQKVPVTEKRNQLILLNKDKIVWVIGFRIDDRFKITNKTQRVLKLCMEHLKMK